MKTVVINIKTNPKVKSEAQKIADELGFSLSALINGYLKQLVKTKTISFSLVDEEPSEYMKQALRESEEDRRSGRFVSFISADEALNFVDQIIDEAKN